MKPVGTRRNSGRFHELEKQANMGEDLVRNYAGPFFITSMPAEAKEALTVTAKGTIGIHVHERRNQFTLCMNLSRKWVTMLLRT